MYEDFAPRLAQVITDYSTPIHEGDMVLIGGSTLAEPMIMALYEAVLRRGGLPSTWITLPGLEDRLMVLGNDAQLDHVSPALVPLMETIDVRLVVEAPANTRNESGLDPERSARRSRAFRPMTEVFWQRYAEGELRWNLCPWPTNAAAQDASMSLLDYTGFVYRACALDQPDPVAHWQSVRDQQQRLVGWLAGSERVEVRGPGVDLSFSVAGRTWCSADGVVNMPDGELYTSPVEDSVNGRIAFSYPSIYNGREVRGVTLTFKDGVVTDASAEQGEDFLLSQLNIDTGARRVGEFAIGTNPGIQSITGSTLFDEKIGGTIHMALGESYPEAGGKNKSIIHWDIVHAMAQGGEIWIDGKLFYQSGAFQV